MRNRTKGFLMLAPLIAAVIFGYLYAVGGWDAVIGGSIFAAVMAWLIKAIDLIVTRDD